MGWPASILTLPTVNSSRGSIERQRGARSKGNTEQDILPRLSSSLGSRCGSGCRCEWVATSLYVLYIVETAAIEARKERRPSHPACRSAPKGNEYIGQEQPTNAKWCIWKDQRRRFVLLWQSRSWQFNLFEAPAYPPDLPQYSNTSCPYIDLAHLSWPDIETGDLAASGSRCAV